MKNLFVRGFSALILSSFFISSLLADYQATIVNFGSLEIFSYTDYNTVTIYDKNHSYLFSDTIRKGLSYYCKPPIENEVYIIEADERFTVLNGDGSGNTISGYYVMDTFDRGISTELYTSFPTSSGRLIVFAHEDETYVDVGTYSGHDDPNTGEPAFTSIMRPTDPNYLNTGEHIEWNSNIVAGDNIRILSDKGVSALCVTDSGYFVPASNGTFSGQEFYTFFSDVGGTETFVFVSYNDYTTVTISQNGQPFDELVLSKGQVYEMNMFEIPGSVDEYYEIVSSNTISVAVYNSNNRLVFAPGEDGSGFGSLENYTLLNMLDKDDNLHVLSHANNTTINLYNTANGLSADSGGTATDIFPALLDKGEKVKATNGGVDIGCLKDHNYDVEVDSDDFVSVYYGYTDNCYAEFVPLGFDIIKPAGFDPNNLYVYNDADELIDLSNDGFSTDPNDTAFYYDVLPGDEIDININGTFTGTDTNVTAKLYFAPEMDIDFATAMSGNYEEKYHAYTISLGDMPATVNETLTVTINKLAKPGTSIKFHIKYESDQHRQMAHYHLEVGYWTADDAVEGVVYVDQNATGYASGTSWRNAFTDINQAMLFIEESYYDYDSIWVAAGAYSPTTYCDLNDDSFKLYEGLSMYGGFAGDESSLDDRNIVTNKTILDGNPYDDSEEQKTNAVTISGNNTVLNGFIIKDSGQAGIKVNNTSTTGNPPQISFCTVTGNTTYGIDIENSSIKISNCNIYNNGYSAINTDSNGDISILNSFIHKNTGGINIAGANSSDEIRGNTIAYNSGTGITADGGVQVISNIVWENDSQLSGPFTPEYSCVQDLDPNNILDDCVQDPNYNIQCDPLFAYPYQDPNFLLSDYYDLHLSIESPCKEYGMTSAVDTVNEVDIDGSSRLEDDDVDMGADEISCWETNTIYDINEDSRIDLYEFAGMSATWLEEPNIWNPDYNWADTGTSEEIIDVDDFAILAEYWLWRPCYITDSTISDMVETMSLSTMSVSAMSLESTASVSTDSTTAEVSTASLSVFDLTSTANDPVVSDEIVTRNLSRSNLLDTKAAVDIQNPTPAIMALQFLQLEQFVEEVKDEMPKDEYKKLMKEILETKKELYIMYMRTQLIKSSK